MVKEIQKNLQGPGDKQWTKVLQSFCKTGLGEYGEGDVFLGIRVPELRKLAKEYQDIPSREVRQLLKIPIHEEKLLALLPEM